MGEKLPRRRENVPPDRSKSRQARKRYPDRKEFLLFEKIGFARLTKTPNELYRKIGGRANPRAEKDTAGQKTPPLLAERGSMKTKILRYTIYLMMAIWRVAQTHVF